MVTIRKTVVSHFNPRSPHGERRTGDTQVKARFGISIHAPRTGSDTIRKTVVSRIVISIHAPRTGSDSNAGTKRCWSTDFNPRSPHGERHHQAQVDAQKLRFQSTLPARGATILTKQWQSTITNFNPRSPHGERHKLDPVIGRDSEISIHAPRTGSDSAC